MSHLHTLVFFSFASFLYQYIPLWLVVHSGTLFRSDFTLRILSTNLMFLLFTKISPRHLNNPLMGEVLLNSSLICKLRYVRNAQNHLKKILQSSLIHHAVQHPYESLNAVLVYPASPMIVRGRNRTEKGIILFYRSCAHETKVFGESQRMVSKRSK